MPFPRDTDSLESRQEQLCQELATIGNFRPGSPGGPSPPLRQALLPVLRPGRPRPWPVLVSHPHRWRQIRQPQDPAPSGRGNSSRHLSSNTRPSLGRVVCRVNSLRSVRKQTSASSFHCFADNRLDVWLRSIWLASRAVARAAAGTLALGVPQQLRHLHLEDLLDGAADASRARSASCSKAFCNQALPVVRFLSAIVCLLFGLIHQGTPAGDGQSPPPPVFCRTSCTQPGTRNIGEVALPDLG